MNHIKKINYIKYIFWFKKINKLLHYTNIFVIVYILWSDCSNNTQLSALFRVR